MDCGVYVVEFDSIQDYGSVAVVAECNAQAIEFVIDRYRHCNVQIKNSTKVDSIGIIEANTKESFSGYR